MSGQTTILGRSSGITGSGGEYIRYSIATNGREAYVYEPARVRRNEHTSMLILVHGMASSREAAEGGPFGEQRDAALDAGFIVAAPSTGNLWGNQQVMSDLATVYDWAAHRYWIDAVTMFGHSMGGMGVVVAAARKPVPDLAAVVSWNGVLDTHEFGGEYPLGAYGATDYDDLLAKQAGHDPMRDPASNWAGANILFIATPTDGTRAMAEAFIARAETPETLTTLFHASNHNANPHAAEASAYLLAAMPPYDPDQDEPTHYPVPAWPDAPDPQPIGGGGQASSGAHLTTGVPAHLYTTSGTPVSLREAT